MNTAAIRTGSVLARTAIVGAIVVTASADRAQSAEPALTPSSHLVCTPQPLICTTFAGGKEAFSPLVQHLLVRRQLEMQPKGWEMIYLYVPSMDPRALEEMQIRFLDDLMARHRETEAKAEAEEKKAAQSAEAKPEKQP